VTVRRDKSGSIVLEGDSGTEDAELLLQMLIETPAAPVDWTSCGDLHTAVVQVILTAKPRFTGVCGDVWLRQWLQG
jgi:hypothetical protein